MCIHASERFFLKLPNYKIYVSMCLKNTPYNYKIMILKKYCVFVFVLFLSLNNFAQGRKGKLIDSLQTEKLDEVVISPLHINSDLLDAPASIGILSNSQLLQ